MQISVDGDTSTNDTVLGLASGLSGGATISDSNSEEAKQLEAATTAILQAIPSCNPVAVRKSHFELFEITHALQFELQMNSLKKQCL